MTFSDIALEVNTGYSTSLCSMDDAPDWLDELEEHVQDKTGHYDRFTCAFLARSLKRINEHLEDDQPVRMPPIQPKDYKDDRLGSWFNNRDRSEYMRKGEYAYYDRLDMAVEKDVKKAKRVGAKIEHREIFETTYNYLVENDIIEPPVPEAKRKHKDLTNSAGKIDLDAIRRNEKDEAIQDALEQLQDTYSEGEFVHNREPVELTNPEVASDKERPALNMEIAFGLSLLSLTEQEEVNFAQNLQAEKNDEDQVLINDSSESDSPDVSAALESEAVLGEVTALGKKDDLIKEYKRALRNGQNYAEERDLEAEELPAYLTTTRELRTEEDKFENEFWNRAFNSHDSRLPNIIPASLERHAKLFRALKELDDGSLENFERMLRGLSYAARQHDQSHSKYDNAQDWLEHSVNHIYERIVEGDAQSLRDLTVTITTEDGEQIKWPLIVNGKNLEPIVKELNDLDELMGTAERPFEVDGDLAWDDAIDELYEQAYDLYDGVSGLLGYESSERESFSSVEDTMKFPFLLGELRELESKWIRQTNHSLNDFVYYFNRAIQNLPDLDGIDLSNGHNEIYQEVHKKTTYKLLRHLEREKIITISQGDELENKMDSIQNLEDLQEFIHICFEKAGIQMKCNKDFKETVDN